MEVWADNLRGALYEAIRSRREFERGVGYTSDSALVAGWQQILDGIEKENVRYLTLKDTKEYPALSIR
jgi:hypothetical protein